MNSEYQERVYAYKSRENMPSTDKRDRSVVRLEYTLTNQRLSRTIREIPRHIWSNNHGKNT